MTRFCNKSYTLLLSSMEKEEVKDGSIVTSFRLPEYIEGLKRISVTIATQDIFRVQRNFPDRHYSCMDIIKKHVQHLLSIEPSVCSLEEMALSNVVVTKDGRIKVG